MRLVNCEAPRRLAPGRDKDTPKHLIIPPSSQPYSAWRTGSTGYCRGQTVLPTAFALIISQSMFLHQLIRLDRCQRLPLTFVRTTVGRQRSGNRANSYSQHLSNIYNCSLRFPNLYKVTITADGKNRSLKAVGVKYFFAIEQSTLTCSVPGII